MGPWCLRKPNAFIEGKRLGNQVNKTTAFGRNCPSSYSISSTPSFVFFIHGVSSSGRLQIFGVLHPRSTKNLQKIFGASRLKRPEIWEIPQGGVNEGEDLETAVKRELTEETGAVSAEIIAELPYWLTYDFPPELSIKLSKHWGVRYKGQAHKWFLLKFTGKDEEINLVGDGTEKQEFGNWLWMSIEQILNQAEISRKPAYGQVMKEFGNLIQGNGEDDISIKQSEPQLV